jgi:Domain of unknown function (DUF5615)
MDEHVPAAISEALRVRGVDVVTVQEDARSGADDDDLLVRSAELGRVIFSQDADFLRLAAATQRAGDLFAGVIYSHQAAMSVGECVDELQLVAEACTVEELANRVLYLPLR